MSVLLCKCGNQCSVNNWDRTTRSVCHRCGRQWEYRRMTDANDWVEVVPSWQDRCIQYEQERREPVRVKLPRESWQRMNYGRTEWIRVDVVFDALRAHGLEVADA